MRHIVYYIRIFWAFVKNTFARESDYRGNLIAEIVDSLLNFVINITFFDVLYLNVDAISGWNSDQMLILIAISQLITSIIYMLFMNNLPRIQRYIFSGDFDYILLKPCDEQFYVSFRYFYFGALPNLVFSIALLGYAAKLLEICINVWQVVTFIFLVLGGVVICYSLWLMVMTLSFTLLKIGQMHELFLSALRFLEYPQGIYKGFIRIIVLYIVPIVTASNVPAEFILKKTNVKEGLYIFVLACIFFVLSRILWKLSLKKYTSASS